MRQVKVETVCLDYGNPTPRPAIKYEIRPMSAATDKAGLAEVASCSAGTRSVIVPRSWPPGTSATA